MFVTVAKYSSASETNVMTVDVLDVFHQLRAQNPLRCLIGVTANDDVQENAEVEGDSLGTLDNLLEVDAKTLNIIGFQNDFTINHILMIAALEL